MNALLSMSPAPFSGDCDRGADGCGKCRQCKANRRMALAKKVDADTPYLGLKSFAVLFPEPRWMKCAHGPLLHGEEDHATYTGLSTRFPPPEEATNGRTG
jgi:hypothetical protein